MSDHRLMDLRPFPQLQRRRWLPLNVLRAAYSRATNNERAFRWINRGFVRGLQELKVPTLSAPGARVARELKVNGVAIADFSEFFDPAFLGVLRDAFDRYRDEFLRQHNGKEKGKQVFLDTIHKAHTFVTNDPVSTYLAEPMFAAIAADYMQMVPRYVGSSFWHTKPAPADRLYSQRWHRDYKRSPLGEMVSLSQRCRPRERIF